MADKADAPEPDIFIKKIPPPPPAPHGGAWKVAYADFVTAMMAFFLLLWLLNATTEEQLEGISNFFEPVGVRKGSSGSEGLFGGISATDPGPIEKPARPLQLRPQIDRTFGSKATNEDKIVPDGVRDLPNLTDSKSQHEEAQFKAADAAIQQAIDEVPELRSLHEAIRINMTDEGLRIQLIDQKETAMFEEGSATLKPYMRDILVLIASVVERMPNRLTISGHTDGADFVGPNGETNWELSFARALAARDVIAGAGIPNVRFAEVIGRADREPLIPDQPVSPQNRRVDIVLKREERDPNSEIPAPPRIFGAQ